MGSQDERKIGSSHAPSRTPPRHAGREPRPQFARGELKRPPSGRGGGDGTAQGSEISRAAKRPRAHRASDERIAAPWPSPRPGQRPGRTPGRSGTQRLNPTGHPRHAVHEWAGKALFGLRSRGQQAQ
jgi:hypothetical protein